MSSDLVVRSPVKQAMIASVEHLGDSVTVLVESIIDGDWVFDLDAIGAAEIGRLVHLIERLDDEIGQANNKRVLDLMAMRERFSAHLARWLREYGLTPDSRIALQAAIKGMME